MTLIREPFTKNNRVIPSQLNPIPASYSKPSSKQGTLVPLYYDTWESFSYPEHLQKLKKTAWIYLPYNYDEKQKYDIFYLSHGGQSNEERMLGTDERPSELKYAVDHAIEDGLMEPMILVAPTYNNTSDTDSWNFSLGIYLTRQFHNELLNDLIPAVESKYHTWADYDTSLENLKAQRDHRGFGGYAMGSVNTWHTFEHCLDYFRYFMPLSGSIGDGKWTEEVIQNSDWSDEDFFIWSAAGSEDYTAPGLSYQIDNMLKNSSDLFHLADNELDGNLSYRIYEGAKHGTEASNLLAFNGLQWFWNLN